MALRCKPPNPIHPPPLPAIPAITSKKVAIFNTPSLVLPAPPSRVKANSPRHSAIIPPPRQQKYVYPEPIPEFAAAETKKFKVELLKKLSKEKDTFGNDLQTVVDACAQVFNHFLQEEYGGPGTLLIEPFTEMMITLKEKNLPGAPLAARSALLWAQKYVDQDWEIWNSKPQK